MSSQSNQLLDDALEESFNVLEDGKEEAKENVVFSADDFLPMTGKVAPPQEKPPPLPAVPPPDLVNVSFNIQFVTLKKRRKSILPACFTKT